MSRLHRLRPDELSKEQRELYDILVGGPRRSMGKLTDDEGRLGGPLNTILHAPGIGMAQQTFGAGLVTELSLSPRVKELAVLSIANHERSDFQRVSHERIGREAGLSDEQMIALRERREPPLEDPVESIAWRTTAALLADGDLDDEAYDEAVRVLGERGLIELTALIGYYHMLALQIRVFRIAIEGAGPQVSLASSANGSEGSRT